jgi:hypothetical protein
MENFGRRKAIRGGITSLVVMACVVAVSGGAMAASAQKLVVKDTTGVIDKFVVMDNGNIGVNYSTPTYPLQIKSPGATAVTTLEFHNTGNPNNQSAYDSPAVQLMKNNVATVNTGIPRSGDRLGNFAFGSYLNNAAKYSAFIAAFAEGTWTNTSYSGALSLQTAGPADVYPAERLRITGSGNVGIGTAIPGQKLEVNGGIRLNTAVVKPVCSITVRGTLWFVNAAVGVADSLEVCVKDASENYVWKPLF